VSLPWRQSALAAVALWTAALGPPIPARGDVALDAERRLKALDDQLRFVEQEFSRSEESGATRARRRFSQGEIQFLLEDFGHAAILLYDATEEPEFRASADYRRAVYYLGECLYQEGDYVAARRYMQKVLAAGEGPHRRGAVLRLLAIALRLGSHDGLDALMAQAREIFGGQPPPELPYLAARTLYRRRDLPPQERAARALEAFAAVPPPYHLAAAYHRGVLRLEARDLPAAAGEFEGCTRLEAGDARQKEVRELCFLALGRIHSELGRTSEAIDRYQEIPRESPRFSEALYEVAWAYLKAKRDEQALRTAALISDLSPDSPLAVEAAILQGHLQWRLGRHAEAVETYSRVKDRYALIRDQMDAALATQKDPVSYFDALVGPSGKATGRPNLLPPLAAKWAATSTEVGQALKLVGGVDAGRGDLSEGYEIAGRIEAALSRAAAIDAFPHLKEGFGRAEAAQNSVVRLEAEIVDAEEELVKGDLPPGASAELSRARAHRSDLESRVLGLPRTAEESRARQERMKARLAEVERRAEELGQAVESSRAVLTGTQAWLDEHRAEGSDSSRAQVQGEMSTHREAVAGYEGQLQALRLEIAQETDAVGGAEQSAGDAAVRQQYRRALAREVELLGAASDTLSSPARSRMRSLEAYRARVPQLLRRAERAQWVLRVSARSAASDMRRRVLAERGFLGRHGRDLDGVQDETKILVGRMALESFREVRAQLNLLVLKADVGLLDTAWQRKRERLDRIQALSAQKSADMAAMEEEFKGVLREVR
jgi:tetratricopeptide (TPR) repeat protein